ncbi:MAG: branched-chain amino acid transaminase [Acidimicrobiia bacterium]|nr:branched-chain amino acid transaminase [Acidimicrobiia bacterium]MDH3470039.1 branched-chain amino acid transaminase [Acidimicrobiia bacterium]
MEPVKSIWMDGELVPWAEANVHVLTHGLHYGTGVFEGIRAYGNDEGTAVFRLSDHMQRLHNSATTYSIPLKYSVDELAAATRQLLLDNELDSAYIRPIVFYGSGTMGLNPSKATVVASIVAFHWGAYLGEEGLQNGIRVKIASWARISPRSFPAGKATGPYINSVLANQEATSAGYDEALLLTEAGNVSEGSGENLFVVRDGEVLTPPVSDGCLNGITRQSVIQLLADDGQEVIEKSMTRDDLYAADELFFTGTAAEVTPIRHLDDHEVGDGTPGLITRRAQELFRDAVGGKLAAYRDWLDYI